MMWFLSCIVVTLFSISHGLAAPLVFAHYMLIIQPPNGDYTNDITLAKKAGIDAFAVNYGGWDADWNALSGYLGRFYQAAAEQDFKLFMSYDTDSMKDPDMMVNISNSYAEHSAQLRVDDKIFLSSFSSDPPAFNWQTEVLDKISAPVMFMPGTLNDNAELVAAANVGAGPFPWIHPASSVEQEAAFDTGFAEQQKATGRPWMAGITPWFFKRMGMDLNWLNGQDAGLWYDCWLHLLQLQPTFIEIITWNDYGESSYIGPSSSSNDLPYDGLDHSAFLAMTSLFTKLFKDGATDQFSISPEDEDVFMFYRLQPAQKNGAQDTLPLPKNVDDIQDNVYVISFLAEDAVVTLSSGGKEIKINCSQGLSKKAVPWTLGEQSLTMSRSLGNGETVNKKGPTIVGQMDSYNGNVVAL